MSKFQIVKGITDNLSETPYTEGKVYFTYDNAESTNLDIYADIDGTRRKIKEGVQRDELDDYLLKTDIANWAKEVAKPTYTAAEVGATTISEVNSAIATAIGNINQFNVAIVSTLPTENIDDHTIYFMSNGGSDDSIYDEWMYINNNWEKIGTTAVDLSGYMQTSHPANGITSTDITKWNNKSNTDENVKQVYDNSSSLYPILLSSQFRDTTTTGYTYKNSNVYVSPKDGLLHANKIQVGSTSKSGEILLGGSKFYGTNDGTSYTVTLPAANGTVALTSDIPTVPTTVSSFTNDSGYLTLADLPIYDGTVV